MTIYYNGPVEEYYVRDCSTGNVVIRKDLDAARQQFEAWKISRPNHPLMLIAVIEST